MQLRGIQANSKVQVQTPPAAIDCTRLRAGTGAACVARTSAHRHHGLQIVLPRSKLLHRVSVEIHRTSCERMALCSSLQSSVSAKHVRASDSQQPYSSHPLPNDTSQRKPGSLEGTASEPRWKQKQKVRNTYDPSGGVKPVGRRHSGRGLARSNGCGSANATTHKSLAVADPVKTEKTACPSIYILNTHLNSTLRGVDVHMSRT